MPSKDIFIGTQNGNVYKATGEKCGEENPNK